MFVHVHVCIQAYTELSLALTEAAVRGAIPVRGHRSWPPVFSVKEMSSNRRHTHTITLPRTACQPVAQSRQVSTINSESSHAPHTHTHTPIPTPSHISARFVFWSLITGVCYNTSQKRRRGVRGEAEECVEWSWQFSQVESVNSILIILSFASRHVWLSSKESSSSSAFCLSVLGVVFASWNVLPLISR